VVCFERFQQKPTQNDEFTFFGSNHAPPLAIDGVTENTENIASVKGCR